MSGIVLASGEPTMGSRGIADLVEKRHDNVKRVIETLASKGVIESPQTQVIRTATNKGTEYRVGRRDSYIIVAQLSPEFTARLVNRWQQLAARAAQALAFDLPNPASLRTLLLGYTEKVLELEAAVAEQAPKVEVHDHTGTPAHGDIRCCAGGALTAKMPIKFWSVST
jgi:hypothetical protein